MKFSSQEEYGLRCLMQVGRCGVGGSVTIPEISKREGLTEPYVAKLLMILRKAGLITSTRGHAGGYALAFPPEQITISKALAALGGRLYEDDFCEKHGGQNETCAHAGGCSIKGLWSEVQKAVDGVLDSMTLAQILKEENAAELIQVQSAPPKRFSTVS